MEDLKERLREEFINALKDAKRFRLVFRPDGIKFDENRAMVRLDLDEYKGFSIGSACFPPGRANIYGYPIVAFVEMTGYLKGGGGIKIKDMCCVLAERRGTGGNGGGEYHFLTAHDRSIFLYRVKDLKKVYG